MIVVIPSPRVGAFRTATLNALSYRFAVSTDDSTIASSLDQVLAGLRSDENDQVDHWYRITPSKEDWSAFDVWRDQVLLAEGQTPNDAAGWIVWDVNRSAVQAAEADFLLFHAAGVEMVGAGLVLPGVSGAGKSSLAAELCRSGAGYLSDELVAYDMARNCILPYAKPITIKAENHDVLRALESAPAACTDGHYSAVQERLMPVGRGTTIRLATPCAPSFVVVPHYEHGSPTTLVPLSDTEAFFALAVNAVNLKTHGTTATEALGRLVGGCTSVRLTFSDLGDACELVQQLVSALPTGRSASRD